MRKVLLLAGVALLGVAAPGETLAAPEERLYVDGSHTPARLGPTTFADLCARVGPAVVGIEVRTGRTALEPGQDRPGIGTGFIIHHDGWILTNSHVVEGAEEIRVRLSSRREYVARFVGGDERADIALIKIDGAGALTVAPLGDSDALRIGEFVFAIGNPFGLDHSVTAGIVSAKGRRGRDVRLRESAQGYFDFIQTDAAINKGNSGGPLFNLRGEAIGINTAMLGGPQAQAPGISFAVPINMAKKLLPILKQHGRVRRSWLGIKIQHLSPTLGEALRVSNIEGALINHVEAGSPAEEAGLKLGDVVLEFDGRKVHRSDDLAWLTSTAGVGRKVPMVVWRGGRRQRLEVKMILHPDDRRPFVPQSPPPRPRRSPLGIEVSSLTAETAGRLGVCPAAGVTVTALEPDAPAAAEGVLRHDRVLQVGDTPVRTLDDYARLVRAIPPRSIIRLLLARYADTQPGCEERVSYVWVAFLRR
jgi:serine protease Do